MTWVRKNATALTVQECDRLVAALKVVHSRGVVERFARLHEHHFNMNIHRSSHFLPWHREMLVRFERELQSVDPRVSLPYWDSSVDQSPSASLWRHSFLGQFDGLWRLQRSLGTVASLPSPALVQRTQSRTGYGTYWDELERLVHNPPHRWVGGQMATVTSPRDPVFYLHHAWIDLLWVQWQRANPNAAFVSSMSGAGLNDPLMEWPDRTAAMVLDHHRMRYAYDVEPLVTGPAPSSPDMQPGEVLAAGQSIRSANGHYTLVYQGDGNLVLYGPAGAMWASNTDGRPVGSVIMQGDGNLVVYGPGGLPVWATGTDGNPGAHLVVQDDGNVVVYRTNRTPAWASTTNVPSGPAPTSPDMQPGEVLLPGQSVSSTSGRYRFVYQGDGNLVLYGPAGATWSSRTNGARAGSTIMQPDGNLVVYRPGGQAVWASNTHGNAGSHLVVQDDGNVVIYRRDRTPGWATNTNVPTGPVASAPDMQPGEMLVPGQSIGSASGRYRFVYQMDGNLVLYGPAGAMWSSRTDGKPAGSTVMQSDGNLVVYRPGGQAVWASNTHGNAGARLVVQDDGNVVIYRTNGTPAWATNTNVVTGPAPSSPDMQQGEVLAVGQSIRSGNGRYTFVYQADGNLVLYGPNGATWASRTNGKPAGSAIMQADGNLVIYRPGGTPIWASNTHGNPGANLVVQDDGNVVIYRSNRTPAWATNTNV
jgi:outer membrane lipoprotein-sorting protein